MKRKIIKTAVSSIIAASVLTCVAWYYQANYAENLMSIRVPKWIAGGGSVSYSIAIHKSQIKPYGTVWRGESGPGYFSNMPIYSEKDLRNYLNRHRQQERPNL